MGNNSSSLPHYGMWGSVAISQREPRPKTDLELFGYEKPLVLVFSFGEVKKITTELPLTNCGTCFLTPAIHCVLNISLGDEWGQGSSNVGRSLGKFCQSYSKICGLGIKPTYNQ